MYIVADRNVFVASARPSRLPPGWLDTPDHARTRDLLRRWYISTINELVPALLDDLACDPFIHFQKAASAGIELTGWLHDVLILLIDDPSQLPQVIGADYWKLNELDDPAGPLSRQESEAQAFRSSLLAWAERWNLPWETWCIGQAMYCLREWSRNGAGDPGERQWHCICGGVAGDPRDLVIIPGDGMVLTLGLREMEDVAVEEAPTFALVAPGSDTRIEQPSETEARLRALFESQLREHLESRTRPLPVPPLVSPPKLREPGNHLNWLVRYNVLKESFGDIARETGRARSTVSEGIKGIAAFARIALREPDPPGRPSR